MNSLQSIGGRTRAICTGILLTALISLSLIGALVVQWGSAHDENGNGDVIRTSLATRDTLGPGTIKQGLVAPYTPAPGQDIVRSRDFGLWSYVATRETTGLNADLSYQFKTASDLREYVAMNRERAAWLASAGGEVDVLVTFRRLLSPAEFREWAADCGIDVSQVSVRLAAVGGVPGTLTISGRKGDPLPQAALEKGQKKLPPVQGVYSVRGKASASMLSALLLEPLVFVADVTPTLTRLDLIGAGIPGAQDATIACESPFDEMEKLAVR